MKKAPQYNSMKSEWMCLTALTVTFDILIGER